MEVTTTSASNPIFKPSRLGNCAVCEKPYGKYKCPACEIISCSLECTLKHKKDDDCDGIRSRTGFVKIKQFDNFNLLNDYRLLEEIALKVDSCEWDKLNAPHLEASPLRMHKLKAAVFERGARLILLPLEFQQRKANTSHLDFKTNTISWRIQLNFLNSKKLTINQDRCSENIVLKDLIDKYLTESVRFPDAVSRKLACYRTAGIDSITVLMKAEKVPLSDTKFFKLDLQQTLRENFVGKIIVEFPQLFILINGFFKTETTKLHDGGFEEKLKNKPTNFLVSSPEKGRKRKAPRSKPPKKMIKAKDDLSDTSSSESDLDWNDTEDFFAPWYGRLEDEH